MQRPHSVDPISATFGDDTPEVTYDHIAAQVRAMKPRALAPSQYDDVVVLIEFMRDAVLKLADRNTQDAKELAMREAAVAKRERDVALRQRTHDAATRTRGLARYFRR